MFLRLLLIFGLLTAIESMISIEDNSPSSNSRIMGGANITRAGVASIIVEIPHLRIKVAICSGFIITNRWIGTSAKCTNDAKGSDFFIGVGSNNIPDSQHYEVMDVLIHEHFSVSRNNCKFEERLLSRF